MRGQLKWRTSSPKITRFICARFELDVRSQDSADAAIHRIVGENKRLDVVIHNAGHMVFGPAGAFMPEQLAELYDINVLSTQRVNRAVLPQLRSRGMVCWYGFQGAVQEEELRRIWHHISPRRRVWMPWPWSTPGVDSLRHRDLHHCSGRIHWRHESLCACRLSLK